MLKNKKPLKVYTLINGCICTTISLTFKVPKYLQKKEVRKKSNEESKETHMAAEERVRQHVEAKCSRKVQLHNQLLSTVRSE